LAEGVNVFIPISPSESIVKCLSETVVPPTKVAVVSLLLVFKSLKVVVVASGAFGLNIKLLSITVELPIILAFPAPK
jgi:hypothetical protein